MSFADIFNSMQKKAEQSSNNVGSGYDPNFNYGTPAVATTTPSTAVTTSSIPTYSEPSALSMPADYYAQKAAQQNKVGNSAAYNPFNVAEGAWTAEDVKNAFADMGIRPEDHYNRYGRDEGLTWNNNSIYNMEDPWAESDGTTVAIPGMVDNQTRMNALIPGYFQNLMEGGMDNYNTAYSNLEALPGQIDDWTAEALKRQRVTGDMATNAFNRVANQRAGSGIQGGTENQNLQANAAAQIAQIIFENQNTIQSNADNLKAGTIQQTPGVALQPVSAGLGLYGTTASEAANWGNLAMQTLLSGY